MGCDIHIAIQVQDETGWRHVPWQDGRSSWRRADHPLVPDIPVAPEVFRERNYDLFSILADVRNGSGFAGVRLGSGWPAIAPNRGWPDGFDEAQVPPDPAYPEEGPRWMGDHSFTWVGLEELTTFDWDGVTSELCGVISLEAHLTFAAGIAPIRYCGMTYGPNIVVCDERDYHPRLDPQPTHIRRYWRTTAREATGDWPGEVIPWLQGVSAGRPLRLVLGFDS